MRATMEARSEEEAPLVVYRLLADLVVVVHLVFVVFVAVGGFVAWHWPRAVWIHVPVVVWAAAIVAIGFTCPLTPLEKHFRLQAGGDVYDGGFIDHYIDGVVYPGRYTALARALVAVLIIASYGLLFARRAQSRHDRALHASSLPGHRRRMGAVRWAGRHADGGRRDRGDGRLGIER